MKLSEGIYTYKCPRTNTYGWRCRVCGVNYQGLPNPNHAFIQAKEHFASIEHLVELKRRRDTDKLIDVLFAYVGIGEAHEQRTG